MRSKYRERLAWELTATSPPRKGASETMAPLSMEELVKVLRADAELLQQFDSATWQNFNTHYAKYEVSSSSSCSAPPMQHFLLWKR